MSKDKDSRVRRHTVLKKNIKEPGTQSSGSLAQFFPYKDHTRTRVFCNFTPPLKIPPLPTTIRKADRIYIANDNFAT